MGDQTLAKKVAERAYQLFLKRGGKHGYHQQDWLQAEKEMRAAADSKAAGKPAKAAVVAEKPKKAKAKKSKK